MIMETATVVHEGEAIVLGALKPKAWPEGFFDSIYITDPAFLRPDQGQLPPVRTDQPAATRRAGEAVSGATSTPRFD
jgi:hypothetical protein